MTYHVVWEIDIDADTPYEAAQMAQHYQQLPNTTATVFEVFDENGEAVFIDLLDPEPEEISMR